MVQKLDNTTLLATLAFSNPVWNFNQQAIDQMGIAFLQDYEIASIRLESQDNEVLFEKKKNGDPYAQNLVQLKTKTVYSESNENIGKITIGMTHYYRNLALQTYNISFILSMLVVLGVQVLVITILARTIVAPLIELTHNTKYIADGQLNHRIQIKANDEIGDLAFAFNHMTDQLQAIISDRDKVLKSLEEVNFELEQKVKERTEELIKANQSLVRSEKMASMTQLVAGVAHEMNTPVGICITAVSYIQSLESKLKENQAKGNAKGTDFIHFVEETSAALELIKKSLNTAAKLINTLRISTESHQKFLVESFNVLEIIEDTLMGFKAEIHSNCHFNVSCSLELTLNGSSNSFEQILFSLAYNAVEHAFGESGEGEIQIRVVQKENLIILEFEDNGKGMNAEILGKIFDPFFTTTRGQGSIGLGLFRVYDIMTLQFNGDITCSSTVGTGTIFTLQFPIN
jgi:signal transduction histidine kinase